MLTAADIRSSRHQFLSITQFRFMQRINQHCTMQMEGIVSGDSPELRKRQARYQAWSVQLGDHINFHTVLEQEKIDPTGDVHVASLYAKSKSILLDRDEHSRTWQNKKEIYDDVWGEISDRADNHTAIFGFAGSAHSSTGRLLVQYKETDWKFVHRTATILNEPVVCNPLTPYKSVWGCLRGTKLQ